MSTPKTIQDTNGIEKLYVVLFLQYILFVIKQLLHYGFGQAADVEKNRCPLSTIDPGFYPGFF